MQVFSKTKQNIYIFVDQALPIHIKWFSSSKGRNQMEWNGVGLKILHARPTPNLRRQEILGKIIWCGCSSCCHSSVSSVSNIIFHSLGAFGYRKIQIIFLPSEALSNTLQNYFLQKHLANLIFLLLKHHNYKVDQRNSVLQAPEPWSSTCMRDREFWTPNVTLYTLKTFPCYWATVQSTSSNPW